MNKVKIIRYIDYSIFIVLLILTFAIIFSLSRANIQTDSVDYYSILQKLTERDKPQIVRNLHFVEQRSPGYSIISTLPYYFASYIIEPFVKTEKIIDNKTELSQAPQMPPSLERNGRLNPSESAGGRSSEMIGIPSKSLLARDIFFKDFYLGKEGGMFERNKKKQATPCQPRRNS